VDNVLKQNLSENVNQVKKNNKYWEGGSLSMLGGSLVTTAWRILRLRMEVLRLRRVAANVLNKQLLTADKGWSYSLEIGHGANNHSL
jgi:hypothetical protein